MTDYQPALTLATKAALEAGVMLRQEFYQEGGPRGGGDKATIDKEVESFLHQTLGPAFPTYGIRAEEDPSRNRAPTDPEKHYWLIDPNDGTSAFHQGYRGASVSIALMRNDQPVLGVIYAYAAPDDAGDLFTWAEGCGPLRRNGKELLPVQWPARLSSAHTILTSHYADQKPEANAKASAPARYRPEPGIAYRLALLAAGEAVAAVGLSHPRDFDYAAGHALLLPSGGVVLDQEGAPVRYSPDEAHKSWHCFAGPLHIAKELASRDWRSALSGPKRVKQRFDLIQPKIGAHCREAKKLSRAQGCMLGQLIGDSLGSLVEFKPPQKIKERDPNGVRRLEDGGVFGTLAGQPTDDSEMALMLARALLEKQGFDDEVIAQAYVAWFDSHCFDMGGTTATALSAAKKALSEGQPASLGARQSANIHSQANGCLMRQSPLGIFCSSRSVHEAIVLARGDASLTHPNEFCQELCALYVATIARAISSDDGPKELYHFARNLAKEQVFSASTQDAILSAESELPHDFLSQMGWAKIAFQNAFYQLLHAKSFEEALVQTVGFGGDTDTNAAICGALLGAVYGREEIPFVWRERVLTCRPIRGAEDVFQPRPSMCWPVDALFIAEQLLTI